MVIRYFKITFAALVSLFCLFFAFQNLANLQACYQAFQYVMSNADHQTYSSSFGPSITSSTLVWLAVASVIGLEIAAGLVSGKGALDLWLARRATAETFNAAKTWALAGLSLGIVIWFGLFGVVGNAYFQMWQTELGRISIADAFRYFATCAFLYLIISSVDE